MSLMGVISTDIMIASGVIGLMAGSFFARKKAAYWNVVTESLADPTGILVFALFLVVGIYAKLLATAQLAEGVVWLSQQINAGPATFVLFMYLVCSILGTAMGTSVGIIIIMTPVLYPAAIALGIHPGLAAGAILSGAATGDHFAPVSDTTIISSSTQRYRGRSGSADVGEVVRARMIYVIPAFFVSCVAYLLVGSFSEEGEQLQVSGDTLFAGEPNPAGLVMLIPMLVVVFTAICRRTVFEALTYGTFVGFALALSCGLIGWGDLLNVENGSAQGILIEGAIQNLSTVVMIILMMGAYGVVRAFGLLDALIKSLKRRQGDSARNTELTMFGIGLMLNFLLIGLAARITVVAGPIFNELGRTQNIHPVRRANILDAVANSFSYVVPWHVWPLFMIVTITPLLEIYPFLTLPKPIDFISTTFYPLVIWIVMLLAVTTGFGRKFECSEGENVANYD